MHPRPAASRPRHVTQLFNYHPPPPVAPEPFFPMTRRPARTCTLEPTPPPFLIHSASSPRQPSASCPLLLSIGWGMSVPALQPFSRGRESVVVRDRAGRVGCQHMMTPPRPHYRRTSMDTDGYTQLLASPGNGDQAHHSSLTSPLG